MSEHEEDVHQHEHLEPGAECPTCHRVVPKVKKDDPHGSKRETISISVPQGEEGVLENLLIALVDKYQEQWPRDYAEMREGVGLEVVGGRSWKYFALHFAAYAALMVPGLEPAEEG